MGRTVGGGRAGVRDFAERELAAPLGIRSLVLEFDAAETMLGGGYVWANARDWARLGLLYLRDGRWAGRRILPEGWVDFTRTPAPAKNNGTYGAHFWVSAEPGPEQWRTLDADIEAFQMNGNAGQFVVMVPDRDLVVVRLGEMHVATWPELNARALRADPRLPRARPGVAVNRWIAIAVFWVLLVAGALAWEWMRDRATVGAGYVAKEVCSCVFVGGRSLESCRPDVPAAMDRVEVELGADRVRASVPAWRSASRATSRRSGACCTSPGPRGRRSSDSDRLRGERRLVAGSKKGLLGRVRAASTSASAGSARRPAASARDGGFAVVAVDGLLVARGGVHPDGGDQRERVDVGGGDVARGDGVHHAARDAGLRGAPGEGRMALARDRRLVHEQGEGFGRKSRPHHGHEGRVPGRGRGQRGGPRGAHRAAARAEHGVQVRRLGARPDERLPDLVRSSLTRVSPGRRP